MPAAGIVCGMLDAVPQTFKRCRNALATEPGSVDLQRVCPFADVSGFRRLLQVQPRCGHPPLRFRSVFMPDPPKTPLEVAERLAARNSAIAGAVTAFGLFLLIWLTGRAWLIDARLEEAAEWDDSAVAQQDALPERAPASLGRTQHQSQGRLDSPVRNHATFQSAVWRGNPALRRPTSDRDRSDLAAIARDHDSSFSRLFTPTAVALPAPASDGTTSIGSELPPPQRPVPAAEQTPQQAENPGNPVIPMPSAERRVERETVEVSAKLLPDQALPPSGETPAHSVKLLPGESPLPLAEATVEPLIEVRSPTRSDFQRLCRKSQDAETGSSDQDALH